MRGTQDEVRLAGRLSGLLYLAGAAVAALLLLLPGDAITRPWVVAAAGALGAAWGLTSLLRIRWEATPAWVAYGSVAAGVVLVAGVHLATDGTAPEVLVLLWFAVAFAAFFFPPRVAAGYVALCVVVHTVLLLRDAGDDGVRAAVVAAAGFVVVAGLVGAGRDVLVRLRLRAEELGAREHRLAEEQAALHRVATAVAAGSAPQAVFTLVAGEAARVLGARATEVVRVADGGREVVVGHHGAPQDDAGPELVAQAPIAVGGARWGDLVARGPQIPADAGEHLRGFAELVGTALCAAEDRVRLSTLAGADALTGAANHRTYRERLAAEASRARRHGRPLSVALVDVDRFADVNDRAGVDVADMVLAEVAALLRRAAREEDVVARLAGDEFAIVLPESDRVQAHQVLERARRLVARSAFLHRWRLTITAGICDLETAGDPESLHRLAEAALYWGKTHGRDVAWIYDAAVVGELDAGERAERTERSDALAGLRALARAVDAKDAGTHDHSERVADLARRLARELGWSARRAAQLAEAALLHDVGKIGVPDAILLKPGPLDDEEREVVEAHATLGAEIVGDVLAPEQVRWIACHHERPDGCGYPEGLQGHEIPEGAAILAAADAFDVMTSERAYRGPMPREEAYAECCALVGRQFREDVVAALGKVVRKGGRFTPQSPSAAR